jgi:galactose mutarotase-like enzyme
LNIKSVTFFMQPEAVVIHSDRISASIHPVGAELRSIKVGPDSHEIIWQRDRSIWEGSAPILFPIVGGLKGGRCIIQGREYAIPKHGLVRRVQWEQLARFGDRVSFACRSNERSRESFPWDWHLVATFSVDGGSLRVDYLLTNSGEEELCASLGSHPAFNLNFGSGDLEDYYLVMDGLKPLPERFKLYGDVLSTCSFPVAWEGRELQLTSTLFDEDALIFKDAGVTAVTLASRSSPRAITMDTGGAPDLGIWAKPRAPYVCIEPWFGFNDPEDHEGDFMRKPGLFRVQPGEAFHTSYTVSMNEAWFSQ